MIFAWRSTRSVYCIHLQEPAHAAGPPRAAVPTPDIHEPITLSMNLEEDTFKVDTGDTRYHWSMQQLHKFFSDDDE